MTKETAVSLNSTVSLRELTVDNYRGVLGLKVAGNQRNYVANNARSIAQAHFHKEAWFRGIYADETAVGFIMLSDEPEKPEYFIWRLMIGEQYQGMGFGRQAIERLIEHVKTRPNATELFVSYVPGGDNSPGDFYKKLGFEDTGRVEHEEVILRMDLTQ